MQIKFQNITNFVSITETNSVQLCKPIQDRLTQSSKFFTRKQIVACSKGMMDPIHLVSQCSGGVRHTQQCANH